MEQPLRQPPAMSDSVLHRRSILSWLFLLASLLASFGTSVLYALRFLYPARARVRRELFVATADAIAVGQSLEFVLPSGAKVAVTRTAAGLVALSNTCPHLGCKVHWESEKSRFFCPCHEGAFDPAGKPIAGPPKAENMSLGAYELTEKDGQLYLVVEEA